MALQESGSPVLERGESSTLLQLREAVTSAPQQFDRAAEEIPEVWSMKLSLLGALLTVPALATLLIPALQVGSSAHVIGFLAYGLGTLCMFLASAAFHSRAGYERTFLKNLDYCAIALMIAGSFTPYCVIVLRTPFGYGVLSLIWLISLCAMSLRISRPKMSKWYFVFLFLTVGWLGGFLAYPVFKGLGVQGTALTLLAGAIYTVGTLVFNRNEDEVEPVGFGAHEVWHLFILAGAAIQYLVLRLYMVPVV